MKILETASRFFCECEQGLRAVGVAAIAEEAGVTRKTLYDRFRSKEDLILAYLQGHPGQEIAPEALAGQLLILHEGACIAHSMRSVDQAAERAEQVAAVLIGTYLPR